MQSKQPTAEVHDPQQELTYSATTPTRTGPGSTSGPSRRADVIPLREATRAWFEVSLQTFGGLAAQTAVMQHKLVDEKRWIGHEGRRDPDHAV
jgi:hypothetical protein